MKPIAIIGASGALGSALALRLGVAGHSIVIGSRDKARAQATADRLNALIKRQGCHAATNEQAVEGVELVFLCVPFRNHSETLNNLRSHLTAGQVVVDTTVPLAAAISGKATRMVGVWQGSAAQQADEMTPEGVHVVSALHSVSAKTLSDLDQEIDEDSLICGDRKADKLLVAEVLSSIKGLRCVDAGRLEQSRITESLTALLIGINARYKTHAGVRLTGVEGDDLWQHAR